MSLDLCTTSQDRGILFSHIYWNPDPQRVVDTLESYEFTQLLKYAALVH